MLFSDPTFFTFFAAYFLLHLLTPPGHRNHLIIAGSTIFYAYWIPGYLWVPYLLLGLSYGGGISLAAASSERQRRKRLIITICLLLIPLITMKYTNFLWVSVIGIFAEIDAPIVDWSLPLGISFITFTVIAYVVNVYQGKFPVERSLTRMASYVLFFPHLIAGPILRPHELIPQLKSPRNALSARFVLGFAIFTLGIVKKLVFADQLAIYVDQVYAADKVLSGLEYLIAIYGFSLQIYCDFSGYTDMAIGLAIMLGVRLPNNFHRPYRSLSLTDFWRRWHVTLSRWLRDYLYIPLGGNRFGFNRQIAAIIVTMVLGGLWHGASWTFALWGLAHGVGIIFSYATRRFGFLGWLAKLPDWVKILVVFHFVTLAWILFRAPDLITAQRVLQGPFLGDWELLGDNIRNLVFPLLLIAVFYATHAFDGHARVRWSLSRLPAAVIWPVLAALWALAITISAGISARFIYFDF